MFQEERLLYIMEHLNKHQSMSVADICQKTGVSRDTARRDIVRLEEQGVVVRTHGGVALPRLHKELATYQDRLIDAFDAKQCIGRIAAGLIRDGETVMLDVSTTVRAVAEQLTAKGVTIVTHSIDNVSALSDREDLQIYLLGGYLNTKNRLLYGPSVLEKIAEIRADKAIIGASAILPDGLYYPFEEDASVKKEMARRVDQVIVVADSTKFRNVSRFRLALDWVDVLITDKDIPEETRKELERQHVEILICDTTTEKED
ncbi:DeoR/GlpR family DNA-binding transcription regulator [Paenibacillus eucommiae]|uniref:DeoR/GlpR family transcriptional regulator of sugar metabolism n=1 Tax=Paenibacillus eucommiae TaxID=1355755 RepID=A0ABS4JBU9_9BACL|nr:DeoR/GlpR family DNA-binding transcription regulator [Paenibacillus eucommiae]MBP1996566.1 DeoR/GlpR family transcriptional regulator of sugar metabolism [Paenibacillus eucommiae]